MNTRYALLALLLTDGCANPLFDLNSTIQKFGYIPYTTPLEYAGTGTLVSGDAAHLEILASPDSCFPETVDINGTPTLLRSIDNTTLPTQSETTTVNVNVAADFFKLLQVGSPSINVTANIQDLQSFTFSFTGAHIEYINAITLQSYYASMNSACKSYLNLVGFIIQAVRVDSMSFTFYQKDDSAVSLDLEKVQEYLDLSAAVAWHIQDNYTLVIDSPKYIGYQLGTLRPEDDGISLYRATSTIFNQFIFKKITTIPLDTGLESQDESLSSHFPTPQAPLNAKFAH